MSPSRDANNSNLAAYTNALKAFLVETTTSDSTAKAETQKENSARPAMAELTYISTGVGQQRIAKVLLFGIAFRNEPHFTTGSATILNPAPKLWHDPIGTAGVRTWERDSRGMYVGAHLWVRTDMYPIATATVPPAKVSTMHYLTFSGTAIKEVAMPKVTELITRQIGMLKDAQSAL